MKNLEKFESFESNEKEEGKLNESMELNYPDLVNDFFDYIGVDIDELKKATYDQIKNLHRNASSSGVYFSEEHLVFSNENTLKNWDYYAGYEYIDNTPNMIKIDGYYFAVYKKYDDDRIESDLDILNGESEIDN